MSNKELCLAIIDSFEEEQLDNVVVLLQSVKNLVSENADEAYCLQLLKDYENDTDPSKEEAVSLQDLSKELGIELE